MPPWGWWPLAVLGICAWAYLLNNSINNSDWKIRFLISFTAGMGCFLPSLIWIVDLTLPGYIVAPIILSVGYGVCGIAALPPARGVFAESKFWTFLSWLIFPASLTLLESIRWRFPFGGAPLSTLPMAFVDSFFSHTVRFLGQPFLVFLVALLATGLAALALFKYKVGLAMVAAVILAAVFLGFAPSPKPTGEVLNVAIVQGGGPQRVRSKDSNPREVFERHLLASQKISKPVDLVVWPENVIDVSKFAGSYENRRLMELARQLDAWLLVGIVEDVDEKTFANYSALLSPEGEQVDLYEKVRRVPFGEYVPLKWLAEPFAPSFLPETEARIGSDPPTVTDGEHIFGVVISWEVFFEDRVREAVKSGAEVILNPTNNSSYWLNIVQSQQIASSKLRAKETGLWVVQSAPTGFSAFVDPSGAVLSKTSIGENAVLQMPVQLKKGKTIAVRAGVYPMMALSLGIILPSWVFYFIFYFKRRFIRAV